MDTQETPGLKEVSATINKSIAAFLQAPFKRSTLILQTQGMIPNIQTPYSGVLNCLRALYAQEGFRSLWRGFSAEFFALAIKGIMTFVIGNNFQKILNPYDSKKEFLKFFLASLGSGLAASTAMLIFTYPFSLIRTRLAADLGRELSDRQFTGIQECMRKIYQSNGLKGFYKGCVTNMIGIVVYRTLYFGSHQGLQPSILGDQAMLVQQILFAQSILIFSGIITYPLDTISRRLSMQAGSDKIMYRGLFDCMTKMIKTEGIRSLFRGLLFQLGMGFVPSLGIVLSSKLSGIPHQ